MTELTIGEARARGIEVLDEETRALISGLGARVESEERVAVGKPGQVKAALPFAKYTDDGVARRVADHLDGVALSVPATADWLVWTGDRWRNDDTSAAKAQIRERLSDEVERHHRDGESWAAKENAAGSGNPVTAKNYPPYKQMLPYLSRSRQEAVTSLVRDFAPLTRSPEEFDRDPYLLATPGATVDLRTGATRKPDPQDLITRLAPTPLDPDAEAPRFKRFLREITGGDRDLQDYLQTVLGYSITGSYRAQELYLLHGDGSNGKDTLLEIVEAVIGEYAGRGVENMLIERQHDKHLAEVYALRGRRLIIFAESDQGKRLNEGRVKEFTGSPSITANAMRQNPVTFPNTWTLVLMTNHLPIVSGTDYGIKRRLVVVPFPVRFYRASEDRPNGSLIREENLATYIIENEPEGVLAWLVEGAIRYHQEGLIRPPAVVKATGEYLGDIAEETGVWSWLQERTESDPGGFTLFAELYADYRAWATAHQKQVATRTALGSTLASHGFEGAKRRGDRGRPNLRLKSAISPETAQELLEMARP